MANTKSREIRNIAIVGTGVIGASWAALYLARGLTLSPPIRRRTRSQHAQLR